LSMLRTFAMFVLPLAITVLHKIALVKHFRVTLMFIKLADGTSTPR
jgi:hypothetical protein